MEPESDGDPREFLVDVKNWKPGDTMKLTVNYFACHKSDNWCKPVTQTYEIVLTDNKAGGRVNGRSHKAGGGGGRRGGRGGNRGGQRRGQQRK